MKILAVAFAYNEHRYIENFIKFYKSQGCDIFVLDNSSTDGTTECLQKHGINHKLIATGGAFDLKMLQRGLLKQIREQKPDWVVYTGVDVRYYFREKTIKDAIFEATREGYNLIGVQYFNMYATGEPFALPLEKNFFYARKYGRIYMIARYIEPFCFEADSIIIPEKKILQSDGCLINYGNCKPAVEREDTFRRRKKAWDRGLDRNYGVHYNEGHERGWRWDKKEMIDIRTTEYYDYINNSDRGKKKTI